MTIESDEQRQAETIAAGMLGRDAYTRWLGLGAAPVRLAAATSVRDILTTMSGAEPPALLVIDSIQTMHSDLIEGAPGTVSQVRASAHELVRFAKEHGTAVVLVGHVTKDGSIAGPRVLEHIDRKSVV